MIISLLKKYRGPLGSLLIPLIGAIAFKFFGDDSPKSFTSIVKLVKGVLIEELHQEVFQLLIEWLW